MVITEQSVIDLVSVKKDGHIDIRRVTRTFDNNVEVKKIYHRHVLAPGQDLIKQDAVVAAKANKAWTPEVITAYEAKKLKT